VLLIRLRRGAANGRPREPALSSRRPRWDLETSAIIRPCGRLSIVCGSKPTPASFTLTRIQSPASRSVLISKSLGRSSTVFIASSAFTVLGISNG